MAPATLESGEYLGDREPEMPWGPTLKANSSPEAFVFGVYRPAVILVAMMKLLGSMHDFALYTVNLHDPPRARPEGKSHEYRYAAFGMASTRRNRSNFDPLSRLVSMASSSSPTRARSGLSLLPFISISISKPRFAVPSSRIGNPSGKDRPFGHALGSGCWEKGKSSLTGQLVG